MSILLICSLSLAYCQSFCQGQCTDRPTLTTSSALETSFGLLKSEGPFLEAGALLPAAMTGMT